MWHLPLFFYIAEHVDISQHEQYSQKEFDAELPGVLQENFHLEGNEAKKQWHCLNKLIDLRHGFGGGKFHYYLLLN